MLPLPAGVLEHLAAARRPVRAELSADGGRTWRPVRVAAGGEVRPDRGAECRYSASVELLDVGLGRDGVSVEAARVRLWQGLAPPRMDTVWVPAGVYVVDSADRTRHGTAVGLLGLEDIIRGAKLPVPRTIGPTTARAIVPELVAEALPGAIVSWRNGVDPDLTVPQIVIEEERWGALSAGSDSAGGATGIAQQIGAELFADAAGVITVAPIPVVDLDAPPVWRVPYGHVRVDSAESTSAEGLVSLWSVTGDGGDGGAAIGPVHTWDDDPTSPTYAGPDPVTDPLAPQRLGLTHVRVRAQRHSSPLITSHAQAVLVGRALLADSLGAQATLTFTGLCNPALEPGDLVDVEPEPGRWERHVVNSCPFTLGGIVQSCTTRTNARR
ncbi:DUF5047 domain-containing protein [Streptomyces sp. NPDC059578]|uniref:DUF5047 domain-containing protein n=1 Tax=Streptomyces sp. NPDC059578 TaxID=3346874 RepID=UPI0036C98DE0